MMSLGLDIGGANTKAILSRDGEVEKHWMKYIPLWKRREELREFLSVLPEADRVKTVGVTMTGELSDVFESKREGVEKIIKAISEYFDVGCHFMSLEGDLLGVEEALDTPMDISAANWVASGLAIGKRYKNCLLVDVGSTTTDLIPVRNGGPISLGSTDFRRLGTGELIYTGILRTPLSYLGSEIEIEGKRIRTASEYFANMADAYRVLEVIDESDYTCDTPDGRSKGRKDCMSRIARVFCSDLEEIGEDFIEKAAERFYERQIALLRDALEEISGREEIEDVNKLVLTGIGRKVLAEKAAEPFDFDQVIDFADIYGLQAALMTPAFAMSLLAGEAFQDE